MLSDKCNLTMVMAMDLIFCCSMSCWPESFGYHRTYVECILCGVTSILLCVPLVFAAGEKGRFGGGIPFIIEIVHDFHSSCFGCIGSFQTVVDLYSV